MIVLRNFERYEPTDPELKKLSVERSVAFISTGGLCWYELRKTLTDGKLKVLLEQGTDKVVGECTSINGLWPLGFDLAEVDILPSHSVLGMKFNENTGEFEDFTLSTAAATELAIRKLSGIRSVALAELESLKLVEEIDTITKEEKSRMAYLKKFLVELTRVPKQAGYPKNIDWPNFQK